MKALSFILTSAILLMPWPVAGEVRRGGSSVAKLRDVAPGPLPEALRVRGAGGLVRPAPDHDAVDIDRQARRAAGDTVGHAIRAAIRGNFEVGFWQGMHRAFDDSYLGADAHADGYRDGHYDPEAEALGRRIGYEAAEVRAEELARGEVEAQFRDLSREPRLNPASRSAERPSLDMPTRGAPILRTVFETTPYSGPHTIDPWRIYRCTSFRELYGGRWSNAESGFRHWEKRQRHGSYWHRLNADEKGRFRVVFLYEYAVGIADRAGKLRRAHHRGFDDGWHHGASLQAEWGYRQGYHEGYGIALTEASHRGFDDTFAPRYDERYRQLFNQWSTEPRPEILQVWLADGNDDGVFEPGEEVLVRYKIANYGGVGAEFPVHYGSAVTATGAYRAEEAVELPRRSVIRSQQPLRLRIAGTTPARTETTAFVELGRSSRGDAQLYEVPFRVAYPLELEAPVRLLGHDAISGRASLAVGLVNRSRRRMPAAAAVHFAGGRAVGPAEPVSALDPGSGLELRFEVDGLEPLELLAGEANFVVEARSDGQLHDDLTYRAPVLATRLQDPALVDYMLALADRGGSRTEVAKAHELALQRLRADWHRAVAVDGNPYREDRKRGSAETALGGLVSAFRTHSASFADPRVFTELVTKIEALAADLPGAHPFLRSQMKKLARQLG